jgi:hypothetical protein
MLLTDIYAYTRGNPISLTDRNGQIGVVGFGIGLVSGRIAGYIVMQPCLEITVPPSEIKR